MIINTGSRTDIVQYYHKWLLKRFEEEYVLTRNPIYKGNITKYILTPKNVECVEFCSKNYKPILNNLNQITDKFNTHFQYTITAYGKDIEPGVPKIDESINTLKELEEIVGEKRICLRYDPLLLTKKYTINTLLKTYEEIASQLTGHIDRCIFSFVEMYKKLDKNMPEIIPLTNKDKTKLAKGLGEISKKYNIPIQTCGTEKNYEEYNIKKSSCINLKTIGDANNITFKELKHKGCREGCGCFENRDIGAYDSCPNKCKYCYANKNPNIVDKNYKKHNPNSPLLIGRVKGTDRINEYDIRKLSYNEKIKYGKLI